VTDPAEGARVETAARVLIVDDMEVNRDLLARHVRREGYEVSMAADGAEGLARLRAEPFDVVFLDVMMPGMSGDVVLAEIKRDDAIRHIPVIMVSAAGEQEIVVKCLELGAEDYLPKPFNPTILRARARAALDRKRLHDQRQLHADNLERELEIGRRIQQHFLPATLPSVSGLEVQVHLASAKQVSGDFYDAFTTGDDGRLMLVVGDVCDKGVGAALFMALFRSLIRATGDPLTGGADRIVGGRRSLVQAAMQTTSAGGLLTRVAGFTNDYIARVHGNANMFATAFLAVVDPSDGTMDYVNAGHEPPLVVSTDGQTRELAGTGPALGLLPDLEFQSGTIVLNPGDMVVVYSDGIVDAQNSMGGVFGSVRLVQVLEERLPSAAEVKARVLAELAAFTDGTDPVDDVTLLVVRRPA
jgi:serine phosphatase RsbU (regulator of sigma subunit)